ncbi:MAG: tol-pal system protein YbgF [Thermoanaerobaculia bacterium]
MNPRAAYAGIALLGLLVGGCSTTGLGTRGESKSEPGSGELEELRKHIVELERRAAMTEVEVKRLRKRVTELEAGSPGPESEVASMPTAGKPTPAALPSRAPAPTPPEPKLEVAELPAIEPAPGPAPAAPAEAASTSNTLSAAAQALYDRGYTLFHQGRYVDSETAFQQFLQQFVDTVLGDNAQFWIAEARYARGDVDGALAAFRETVSRFPDGNKVPDAELKVGDCLRDLGDSEGARRKYRQVVEEHPNSAAAAIAEERLDSLR